MARDRAIADNRISSYDLADSYNRAVAHAYSTALRLSSDLGKIRRSRRRKKDLAVRVTMLAAQPAAAASRLLPAVQRARYGEEYRCELWELASAGAGRRQQIGCALRQLRCAVPLRAAAMSPRRNSAAP